MRDDSVCEALELAILRDATSASMVQAIADTVVRGKKLMESEVKFVDEQAMKKVSVAVQQSISAVLLPQPPSPGDSSLSEERWITSRHKKPSRRTELSSSLMLKR